MNVTFKSISIHNFLSIGDAEVNIQESGFTIVSGINKEIKAQASNGSGKSAIFDSIFWTLTGETMRGTSEVVNENTKEGALCILKFDVDDKEYEILRAKSHSEYGNTVHVIMNGELLSNMTKKSQEIIDTSVLPVASSPQVLGSIIILGQGLPYRFTNLSPSRRKDLLETMSNSSSQIDNLKYGLDSKEGDLNIEISNLNKKIASNKGLIEGLERSRNLLITQKDSQVSVEESQLKINTLKSEIVEFNNAINSASSSADNSSQDLVKYKEIEETVTKYIWSLNSEKSQIIKDLDNLKDGVCPTCNRPYEITSEMIQKREELSARLNQIDSTLSGLEVKRTTIGSTIKSTEEMISNYKNQIESNKWKINENSSEILRIEKSIEQSNDLNSKIVEIDNDIKVKTIENTESEKSALSLEEIISCISYLKRSISRDFKGYILKDIIEFMSDRSKHYSDIIFSEEKSVNIELSGNKILVNLDDRSYENLSGGERQRVDLIVQFALRDMLVVTSGFSCNVLVLDEAFDNLDAQGSEKLVELVTSEFSDIDSVFIITHHSEIDIPYDKTIVVTKDESGVSLVEES